MCLVSLTFDDSSSSHYSIVEPILAKHTIQGVFFVCPRNTKLPYQWINMSKWGHEVGSHSMTHKDFRYVKDISILKQEIVDSKKLIEDSIGRSCNTFAYPKGLTTPISRGLVNKYYKEARITTESKIRIITNIFPIYNNRFLLKGQPFNSILLKKLEKKYNKIFESKTNSWIIFVFHSIGLNNSFCSKKDFEYFIKILSNSGAKVRTIEEVLSTRK